MSTDGTGIEPVGPIRPGLIITGQGPGVILESLEYGMYLVQVDGMEQPFHFERREIQPVLPWIAIQAVNPGAQLPDEDDVLRMQLLSNVIFATEEEVVYWIGRTRAVNEVVYAFNLLTREVCTDQPLLFVENNCPLLDLSCKINEWSAGRFDCYPPELSEAAWLGYRGHTLTDGTIGFGCISALLDLGSKQLLASKIETCMRTVFEYDSSVTASCEEQGRLRDGNSQE